MEALQLVKDVLPMLPNMTLVILGKEVFAAFQMMLHFNGTVKLVNDSCHQLTVCTH